MKNLPGDRSERSEPGAAGKRLGSKVGVMGAGAIGCYVGGLLASTGCEVVFVGRPKAKAEIGTLGLTLSDLDGGSLHLPPEKFIFETEGAALASCPVVLCSVKSAQTASVAAEMDGVLAPGAMVVSLQNGVRNADLLRAGLPGRTVLGAVVTFNVVVKGSGAFRRTTSGPLVIEGSTDPRANELAQTLAAAGLEIKVVPDIRSYQWGKLVINLNNAVGALSDVPTRGLLLSKGYRRVLAAIMREALTVIRRAGIQPGRLGPLPVGLFPLILALPTPILRRVAGAQLKIDPEARSSMWEDLSRGRPTEVDDLNGEIVRLAESTGGKAPLNRRVVEIVHAAEQQGKGSPKLGAEELWARLIAERG